MRVDLVQVARPRALMAGMVGEYVVQRALEEVAAVAPAAMSPPPVPVPLSGSSAA